MFTCEIIGIAVVPGLVVPARIFFRWPDEACCLERLELALGEGATLLQVIGYLFEELHDESWT